MKVLFQFNARRAVLFVFDSLLGILSLYLAFLLRFDGTIPDIYFELLFDLIPFVIVCRGAAYFYFKFYGRFWKYTSLDDLVQIIKAVAVGSFLILCATFIYNRSMSMPRSIFVMDMVLLIMAVGGSRLLWRIFRERANKFHTGSQNQKIPVLIFGAGDEGAHLLRYLNRFAGQYSVKGFIDDDPKKLNNNLNGIKVLGDRGQIPSLVSALEIKEVLVAAHTLTDENLGELAAIFKRACVKSKIIASVLDTSTQQVHISKIRDLEISDLLGRERVSLDLSLTKNLVDGKKVLVTGAGGSIGSELCRQIVEFKPDSLIMVDRCENYLYDLEVSLASEFSSVEKCFRLCSITDREKMETLYQKFRPDLVFHAAAHKHVPLMENHPGEAIHNNIHGTRVVAELAKAYGAEKFVLVSTDKVVQPSSVMGATKCLAEKLIQCLNEEGETQFITVRFGNVLGSHGSVVPLFQKQIANGGPVTITHPDVERYFMLISEAVQLILQSAALGRGGDKFLLEMGQPVNIVALAKKMILLSGCDSEDDVPIKFTGLRPGEKLQEKLVAGNEEIEPTPHEKIKLIKSQERVDGHFMFQAEELCNRSQEATREDIFNLLAELARPNRDRQTQETSLN